jgi:O-antigen ligase
MRWAAESLPHPGRWSREARLSVAGVSSVLILMSAWLYLAIPVLFLPALLGFAIFAVCSLRHPIFGVLILVASQYLPLIIGEVTVFQVLGGLVAVLCLAFFGLTRRELAFSWIVLPLVGFMLITLCSLSFTNDFGGTLYLVRKLILNVLFCLLLINVVDDFKKLRWLLWVIASMALVNALAGAVQFALGLTENSRAKGFQENENQLGEISALGLMIGIYAFLYCDRWWKQVLGLLLCVALSMGVVTSISRGAVVAVLCGLGWIAARERKQRMRVVIIAALALLALPFLPESFHNRFRNLNTDLRGTVALSQRTGLTTRGYFNKAGIRIWKAHPILGVGLGNFGYYYIQPEFNPGLHGDKRLPPHNLYVQALAETGTVGFLVLCWWIAQAGYNFWRAELRVPEDRALNGCLRTAEAVTVVALVMYFSSGNIIYSNLAMILTLSYLCRRCVEKERAAHGLDPAPAPVMTGA